MESQKGHKKFQTAMFVLTFFLKKKSLLGIERNSLDELKMKDLMQFSFFLKSIKYSNEIITKVFF